jgi:prepilin-type N-terminal cleavage/methylation domain-containing protein
MSKNLLERLGIKHRSSRGFTLMEVLVVLGIGTAIAGAMSMSIASITEITPLNNNRALTLRQVQNAGFWISRDVQMAQVVNPEPSGNVLVHLEWDEYDGNNYQVDYVFIDDELRRQLNGDTPGMLIAQNIVVADCDFQQDATFATKYIVTVKAELGQAVVERTYEAWQRTTAP